MSKEDSGRRVGVMLVEDHASFREGLAFLLNREPGFEVVAQAGMLAETRDALEAEIDAAVVDLALPDGSGADLIELLHERDPAIMVLVLSISLQEENLIRAVEAGADGVLDKTSALEEITAAMRRMRAGEALPTQPEILEALRFAAGRGKQREEPGAAPQLAPREREALRHLAEGLGSEGIARELDISPEEERSLMAGVLEKLGAHSRLHALLVAARQGIVEIGYGYR